GLVARLRVFQDEGPADFCRETPGSRALHLLSWQWHTAAAAAAAEREHALERRGLAQELRGGDAGCGRQLEKPASQTRARRTGRRRLLSQRRQALGFPERSGVADPESVGDAMTTKQRRCLAAAAAVLF